MNYNKNNLPSAHLFLDLVPSLLLAYHLHTFITRANQIMINFKQVFFTVTAALVLATNCYAQQYKLEFLPEKSDSVLEHKIEKHDKDILSIFEAIRQLMSQEIRPKRRVGFIN